VSSGAKFNLLHAGHLCRALAGSGFATANVEYRRVGEPGGGTAEALST
jgi:hypothetical protein